MEFIICLVFATALFFVNQRFIDKNLDNTQKEMIFWGVTIFNIILTAVSFSYFTVLNNTPIKTEGDKEKTELTIPEEQEFCDTIYIVVYKEIEKI